MFGKNASARSAVLKAIVCSLLVTSGLSARVDPKVLEAFEKMEKVSMDEAVTGLHKRTTDHKSDMVKVFVTLHADKEGTTVHTAGVRGGSSQQKKTTPTTVAYPTLQATQESVLADLESTHVHVSHKFSVTPALAMGVTRDGLAALAKNPQVKSIGVDEEVVLFENDHRIPRKQKARKLLDAAANVIGSNVRTGNGNDGEGVVVAIVDSGIDTDHADLQNSLIDEACFYVDAYGFGGCPGNCGYYGCSNATGPGASEDQDGHGTHVASIVTSDGIVAAGMHQGIAPKASIVGVKVFGPPGVGTSTSNIIAGLEWLKTTYVDDPEKRLDLINMSLGSLINYPAGAASCDDLDDITRAEYEAIQALRDGGVLTIVSAGNDNADRTGSPACLSNTLAVGASDDDDEPAVFTNSDHLTDVFAPGVDIMAGYVGGGLEELSGTSMASPVTAGCAALLIQSGDATTPEEIELRLESTDVTIRRNGRSYPRINCLPDPVARCSSAPVTIADCSATNEDIFALVDAGSTGGPFSDIYFSGIEAPGVNQATMYVEAHGVVDQCSVQIIVAATEECVRPTTTTTTSTTTTSYVPDNDTCETATDLGMIGYGGSASSMGSTTDATPENFLSCGIWSGYGVWYKFTAAADTSIEAALCGSNYDTRIAIFSAYDATCGSLSCSSYNDDSCGLQSRTTATVTAGETYFIVVSGYSLSKGDYILNVLAGEAPTTTTQSTTTTSTTPAPYNGCSEGESPNAFLTIETDDFAFETTWNITQGELELFSGGPYASDFTTYSHDFCIAPGSYSFSIYDTFGDGICCLEGNGNYTLIVDDEVFEGGEFAFNETVSFVVSDGSSSTTTPEASTTSETATTTPEASTTSESSTTTPEASTTSESSTTTPEASTTSEQQSSTFSTTSQASDICESNCFAANLATGCSDASCQAIVGATDQFCLNSGWDSLCVSAACDLCPGADSCDACSGFSTPLPSTSSSPTTNQESSTIEQESTTTTSTTTSTTETNPIEQGSSTTSTTASTTETAELETTTTNTNPTTSSEQGGNDFSCSAGESDFTVTIIYDSNSLPLQWELLDNASGVQLTHGGSSMAQQSSHFEEFVESVCLGTGAYQFKIHGNSFFELTLDGSVLHSGGGIESEEEVVFGV